MPAPLIFGLGLGLSLGIVVGVVIYNERHNILDKIRQIHDEHEMRRMAAAYQSMTGFDQELDDLSQEYEEQKNKENEDFVDELAEKLEESSLNRDLIDLNEAATSARVDTAEGLRHRRSAAPENVQNTSSLEDSTSDSPSLYQNFTREVSNKISTRAPSDVPQPASAEHIAGNESGYSDDEVSNDGYDYPTDSDQTGDEYTDSDEIDSNYSFADTNLSEEIQDLQDNQTLRQTVPGVIESVGSHEFDFVSEDSDASIRTPSQISMSSDESTDDSAHYVRVSRSRVRQMNGI
ncbi:uncharacterized protein V1516DRAFT_673837 [Lipomyces oligophaga]|uniref:uncharacterized protein n=1 Tax=Lipomyces oligophaga TaxID=45792 RepID=UPI0034CF398B